MKKLLSILSLFAVGGALALGVAGVKSSAKVSEAKADNGKEYRYVPLRDGWIENTSWVSDLNSLIRGRNDRFWSGQASGWDSQERSFNATDEFIDTIHRATSGGDPAKPEEWTPEKWTGNYRTPAILLKDEDHRYISFLFGGGAGSDIFFNVWHEKTGDGRKWPQDYNRNVIEGQQNFFDGSGSFDDNQKPFASRSCNMMFRYYRIPDSVKPGDEFLLFVRDAKTSDYGGFTLGSIHANQTLEDVARSFSAHKAQIKLNEYMSDWTRTANEANLAFYASDAENNYYKEVRDAEAALIDANDGFEENNRLSKWAYDQNNSRYENGDLANINFDRIYSNADYKLGDYFVDNDGKMPLNKTDNLFLTGEPSDVGDDRNCGLPESAKYRLVSPEFTLTGTGLISAKIGGHYSKFSLLDANLNELMTTGNENPSFSDTTMANIFASGARQCTMTRTFLDCRAYLNQRVHVAIEDNRTGGGWNLSFFDEVVTRYNNLPSLTLDVCSQGSSKSATVWNGVIRNKLVVGETYNQKFKSAFDFVETYLNGARSSANGFSWCKADNTALKNAYNSISDADVKTLIDASEDFQYTGVAYTSAVEKTYTIGQSMHAIIYGEYPEQLSRVIGTLFALDNPSSIAIISVIAFSLVAGVVVLVFVKRKKAQN